MISTYNDFIRTGKSANESLKEAALLALDPSF
jgi:hypothetical protein